MFLITTINMSYHPRRPDGTFIRDQMCPIAYDKTRKEFQKMERALGSLHKINSVPYLLYQPIFGWVSDGRIPKKTTFKDKKDKGRMDVLTLYVYIAYWKSNDRDAELNQFLDCVGANQPNDIRQLKIIYDTSV